jgi:hypothetical protein
VFVNTTLRYLIASVAIGALTPIGTARANTLVTYDVYGSFADDEWDPTGPSLPSTPIPLRGTLYVDVTTGTVISADLIIPGGLFAPLNNIYSQSTSANSTGLLYALKVSSLPQDSGDTGYVDFIVPLDQSNPLIGHSFIDIDQGEFYTSGSPSFIPFGLTGYIQATPIPAALTLFAGGVGALGLLGRRRKQSAQAAAA